AVDNSGNDAILGGDVEFVPVAVLEALDLVWADGGIVAHLKLRAADKHAAVGFGGGAEFELEVEVAIEGLGGVEVPAAAAGDLDDAVLDLEFLVRRHRLAGEVFLVLILLDPAGEVLAVEETGVARLGFPVVLGVGWKRQ